MFGHPSEPILIHYPRIVAGRFCFVPVLRYNTRAIWCFDVGDDRFSERIMQRGGAAVGNKFGCRRTRVIFEDTLNKLKYEYRCIAI